MNDRVDHPKDEIELIEILLVIWKWKYLILLGTFACALIAGVISLNRSKIYRVDMLLEPPVAGMDSRGRKIFIDSPETIKTLIEVGVFNTEILDHLQNTNTTVPRSLRFKVSIPRLSDTLMISYEDANIDLAKTILEQLVKQMLEKYNEIVEKYINNYESELLFRKNEISAMDLENKLSVKHIEKVRNRINELVLEMKKLDEKIKLLIDEQNKYLSNTDKQKNLNGALLYNSLIQQLTTIKMIYKNQIDDYYMQVERENDQLKSNQNKADILLIKIRAIKNEMNSIHNIQLIKLPASNRRPIRPKTKLYILASSVVGLVIMLSLAFFLEYLFKHKNRQYQ